MTNPTHTDEQAARRALQDWTEGRRDSALDQLDAAARGGNEHALSLMVQLSSADDAPDGLAARAHAAIEAAPQAPLRDRFRALFLASGRGGTADPAGALAHRLDRAEAGDWLARTELGLLALLAGEAAAGREWLRQAGAGGSGVALAALFREAQETGALTAADLALAPTLAASGHPMAGALIRKAQALPPADERAQPPIEADAVLAAIAAWIAATPPPAEMMSTTPRIARWTAQLPASVCDHVTVSASPLLRPAQVNDLTTGRLIADPHRRSLTATLPDNAMDLVIWAVKARMARLAGCAPDQGEALSVIVYRENEEYRAHFDFLTEATARADARFARQGQRIATSLVRLTDAFEGGATHFPRLDLRWSGARGDALSFDNVEADGQGDRRTLHAGEPVTSGVKVLASLWLRERA